MAGGGWIPTRSATPSTALVPQRKVGFLIPNPAFCSVSRGQRRLGAKEHRARSVTPGVALRVGIQGAAAPRAEVRRLNTDFTDFTLDASLSMEVTQQPFP